VTQVCEGQDRLISSNETHWSAHTFTSQQLLRVLRWIDDDALVLLFACASFSYRNPSSLSVDHLILKYSRSVEPQWLRHHLVACLRNNLDPGCTVSFDFYVWNRHFYFLCLFRKIFHAEDSYKLCSSPQRAHVTFCVKFDKLERASKFWFVCSRHAVLLESPGRGVGSCNCRRHSFAACTTTVIWTYVSNARSWVRSLQASRKFLYTDTWMIGSSLF